MEEAKKVANENFDWNAFENDLGVYDQPKEQIGEAYDKTLSNIAANEVTEGTVIGINKREVVVNIGYKSEGIIPISEFRYNPDLKVGDKITVTNTSDTSTTYTFTISGIYKNSTSSNTSAMGPMGGTSQDADNAIYTSVSTLKSLGLDADTTANDDDNNTTTQLGYTYVLGSADDYETFASDVRQAGLDDTCTVQSADVENHESSLVPLDNLAKFALTLLIVVLAVGAVVLNLFNIRERKYEVGVLTVIGVKKVKVAAQFAIELLIVTMCGIALGVAGGAVASVPVSNQLRLLAGDPDRQPGGAVRSRRRHGRRSRQQL